MGTIEMMIKEDNAGQIQRSERKTGLNMLFLGLGEGWRNCEKKIKIYIYYLNSITFATINNEEIQN